MVELGLPRAASSPADGAKQNAGRTLLGLAAAFGVASLMPDAPPEQQAAAAGATVAAVTTFLAWIGKKRRDRGKRTLL